MTFWRVVRMSWRFHLTPVHLTGRCNITISTTNAGGDECSDGDGREPTPPHPLRVVLARRGPAEVDEQPVAEVLGDGSAEAHHGAGGDLLVQPDEVAPLLGVELLRRRRRGDEVAEQHRQLAALAGRQRGSGLGGRRRDSGGCRHGLETLTAAAAELLAGFVRCPARGTQRAECGPCHFSRG